MKALLAVVLNEHDLQVTLDHATVLQRAKQVKAVPDVRALAHLVRRFGVLDFAGLLLARLKT